MNKNKKNKQNKNKQPKRDAADDFIGMLNTLLPDAVDDPDFNH